MLETILFRGEMTYSYHDIQDGVEFEIKCRTRQRGKERDWKDQDSVLSEVEQHMVQY